MNEARSTGEQPYRIGVLARAYAIIDAVAECPRTVLELSSLLDIDPRTVYRLARNLTGEGYLRRVPNDSHRFALGFRFLQLAQRASQQLDLRTHARPVLEGLAASTGESALLVVRDAVEAVFVSRVDGTNPLRLSVEEGSRRPLGVGAAGKVLLAFAPAEIAERSITGLARLEGETAVDLAKLRREIEEIRMLGIARSRSESTPGAGAIAAPVLDSTGQVVAALALGGPDTRVLDLNGMNNIQAVRRATDQLAGLLGYPGHDDTAV